MVPDSLRQVTASLPWSLRKEVEGYVSSVDDRRGEIAREAGVRLNNERRRRLLFAAGVRRMWAIVESSFWMVDNSLERLAQHDVHRIQMGSTFYRRGGDMNRTLKELRDSLSELLVELEVQKVVEARSLSELLLVVSE